MDEVMQNALNDIVVALAGLIVAMIGYGMVLLRAYFKAKIGQINNRGMREASDFALKRMDETARTVTDEIRQTILSRDPTTGKVINGEYILEKGIKRLQERLDPTAKSILSKKYDYDRLLKIYKSKIEQYSKPPTAPA